MVPIPSSVLRQTGLRESLNLGIRIPGHIGRLEKATVINFDDVPSGTVIDTQYLAQGVTLASVLAGSGARGHAYARNSWNIETAPNGVSVVDPSIAVALFDDATGYVEVRFAQSHRWVSIDAMPVASPDDFRPITAKPYLEVYDAAGVRLGRASYPLNHGDPAWGNWQRLRLDIGSGTIRSARIGSQRDNGCPVYGVFDQLMCSNELTR